MRRTRILPRPSDASSQPPSPSVVDRARAALTKVASHSAQIISLAQSLTTLQREPSLLNKLGISANLLTLLAVRTARPLPHPNVDFRVLVVIGNVDLHAMLAPHHLAWPACYDVDARLHVARYADVDVLVNDDAHASRVCVRTHEDAWRLHSALADVVWREHGPNLQVIATRDDGSPGTGAVRFAPAKEAAAHGSEKARAVWARVAPFVAAGRPRSVLLDGRPGTGKSTLARWLAAQVGGRVLSISASSMSRASPETFEEIVTWLKPDVLLVEDFDRVGTHGEMLSAIERVRLAVKLFVVSTNNLKYMDAAAVRPQRFDELVTVDSLGETFVSGYLGATWDALSPEARARVLAWPVTYLEELTELVSYVPGLVLEDEVAQLEARLAEREVPEWARRLSREGLDA